MSIIRHVTLQKIVAHDFRYDPRKYGGILAKRVGVRTGCTVVTLDVPGVINETSL